MTGRQHVITMYRPHKDDAQLRIKLLILRTRKWLESFVFANVVGQQCSVIQKRTHLVTFCPRPPCVWMGHRDQPRWWRFLKQQEMVKFLNGKRKAPRWFQGLMINWSSQYSEPLRIKGWEYGYNRTSPKGSLNTIFPTLKCPGCPTLFIVAEISLNQGSINMFQSGQSHQFSPRKCQFWMVQPQSWRAKIIRKPPFSTRKPP